jgi:hypothetical protein
MTDRIEDGGPALLPCPFCGGQELGVADNVVWCRACDGSGPDLGHCTGDECRSEAIDLWNRRAPARQMGVDTGRAGE